MVRAYKFYDKLPDGTFAPQSYDMLRHFPNLVKRLREADAAKGFAEGDYDEYDAEGKPGIAIGEELFFNDLPPELALKFVQAEYDGPGDMPEYEGFATYSGKDHVAWNLKHSPGKTPAVVEVEGEPWDPEGWGAGNGDKHPHEVGDESLWKQKIIREVPPEEFSTWTTKWGEENPSANDDYYCDPDSDEWKKSEDREAKAFALRQQRIAELKAYVNRLRTVRDSVKEIE